MVRIMGVMLIAFLASAAAQAPGPAAPTTAATAPAAPTTAATAPTTELMPGGYAPEDLTKLSVQMSKGMNTQDQHTATMFAQQKQQLAEMKAQQLMGNRAGQAEDAHVSASDSLSSASDAAAQAGEARAAANHAVDILNHAKAMLVSMNDKEKKEREAAADQHKKEKATQVNYETATMKADRARSTAAYADQTSASTREDKAAADEAQKQAERQHAASVEKLTRMQADAEEKHNELEISEAQKQKTQASLDKAQGELETIENLLGVKQAEQAKIDVQEQLATKNRELMRQNYDHRQTTAHNLDETAMQAEARAKAAAAHSRDMASVAKAEADEVDNVLKPAAAAVASGPAAA